MRSAGSRTWRSLTAEFVVIVGGVLVALGVDSYVSWRSDRALEEEYLERLIADAEYDLDELDFIDAVSAAALAYLDTLSDPVAVDGLDQARLAGAILVASTSRQADLSRSTFQELVSSGRIGLIRSRRVRTELAEYDRIVTEFAGFWEQMDTRFQDWALSRLSLDEIEAVQASCGEEEMEKGGTVTSACPFPWSSRSLEALRREVGTTEVQRLIRYQTNRLGGTRDIAQLLRTVAWSLRETLATELEELSGG